MLFKLKKKMKTKKLNSNIYKKTEGNNEESDEIQIQDIDDKDNDINFNNDDNNNNKDNEDNLCIIKISDENSSERNIDNVNKNK